MLIFYIFLSFFVNFAECMLLDPMDIAGKQGSADMQVASAMTIRQWNAASMRNAADEIFPASPVADSIAVAKRDSLRRRLRIITDPRPHVAMMRVVYGSRRRYAAGSKQFVFASTIQHGAVGRFSADTAGRLDALSLEIAPYTGSPCRFAHSERAIGVYLEENLSNMVPHALFALIQIKTSLPPCDDCKAFWSGNNFRKSWHRAAIY
jgi:hypothetical protein